MTNAVQNAAEKYHMSEIEREKSEGKKSEGEKSKGEKSERKSERMSKGEQDREREREKERETETNHGAREVFAGNQPATTTAIIVDHCLRRAKEERQ